MALDNTSIDVMVLENMTGVSGEHLGGGRTVERFRELWQVLHHTVDPVKRTRSEHLLNKVIIR